MGLHDFVLRARNFSVVTSDSREVKPGALFVAIRGQSQDGHAFIAQVIEQGAAAVVGEEPPSKFEHGLKGKPYVQVADSREALAELAAAHFGEPSRSMLVLGVTGTSGKTTTTYLLESILKAAGHKVGVIGTVNFRFGEKIYPSTHTTPGAVELQQLLAQMKADGCTAVVMEVSSHALKQRRAHFIAFDGMIFTNLSPEHLDFHPNMEDYFNSKLILFTKLAEDAKAMGKSPVAAVNVETEWGKKLEARLKADGPKAPRLATFDHSREALHSDLLGVRGKFRDVEIESSLLGRFNGDNILGAVTLAVELGIPAATIARGVRELKAVPGRLERVPHPNRVVLVDYAHKSDALEKVLKTLRQSIEEKREGRRLITVMGCGGDRDRLKRPVMGKLAVEISDHAVITSDNPRTEDPNAIIQEILVGTQGHTNLTVEPDRKTAIHKAVDLSRPGDVIVIVGKGHEDYQIIKAPGGGTQKIHFDDREVALEALMSAR